jgi:hypothetical protein
VGFGEGSRRLETFQAKKEVIEEVEKLLREYVYGDELIENKDWDALKAKLK